MKRFIWQNLALVILSVVIILCAFLVEQVGSVLQYQRQAIIGGQLHRLLTGHLVHTNFYHSLMNLTGLLLIWGLAGRGLSQAEWCLALFVSALMVSAGLVLFNPEVQWYRGLSGVLHGLLVVAVLKARQLSALVRGMLLSGLVLKLVLEQGQTGLWHSEQLIGAPVIVNAHLYGLVGGLLSYFLLRQFKSDRMFAHRP